VSKFPKNGVEKILPVLCFVGNHTFAAVRTTESYSSLQSLAVVLANMNNLIANPYINIEGRWQLHILLGGDYKVCVATATTSRSLYTRSFPFPSIVPPVSHGT